MKKIYFVPALFTALLFVSCERDNFGDDGGVELPENGIAFVFNGVQTKSSNSEAMLETPSGISFQVGGEAPGTGFFMSETVTDLNAYGPMTKGSPIYKENITSVEGYNSIDVVTYLMKGAAHNPGNASFDYLAPQGDQTGLYYSHTYPVSPWPKDFDQDVYFFLQMPGTDSNVDELEYDSTDGKIEFDYEAYGTAATQKDILFASMYMSRNQYYHNYRTSGAPVTFYHALTGVKFRTDSDNQGTTKTIITKVEFKGLYGKGHGVFDPSNSEYYSWTVDEDSKSDFSLSIDSPTYEEGYDASVKDNTVNYDKDENDPAFGDSWYSTAKYNTNNLNDEAGSLTFWLIPQAFADHQDVTLEITFKVCTPDTPEGTELHHEVKLGKILGSANVEWKAGQLRTYTLDPKDVDVEIEDDLHRNTADDGTVKDNLHVTNTGNVKEYVRMLVMGNWYNSDGDIVVGYKYKDAAAASAAGGNVDDMADYWSSTHDTYGGGFTNLGTSEKWVRGDGGWYYTDPLGPGADISAVSDPLFDSYEFKDEWLPTIWVPDPETGGRKQAEGLHLVMEVVVQAIGIEDPEGNPYESCWAAWSAACGWTIAPKS